MKKILLSVHPKWCKMIFNGKKTIEVRRNRPKLERALSRFVRRSGRAYKVRRAQRFAARFQTGEGDGCGHDGICSGRAVQNARL